MANYLITAQEVYRVGNEKAVEELINSAKIDNRFTLLKYTREHKERKSKGEIIDDYYKVTLVKSFNDEKEPDTEVLVDFTVNPEFYYPDDED